MGDIDCLIIDKFKNNIDENIFFINLNQSKQLDKYLLINSLASIKNTSFLFKDLKSRISSLSTGIELPTDDLLKVIITKTLSDKQITIINY